jgi:competence protein ComEC
VQKSSAFHDSYVLEVIALNGLDRSGFLLGRMKSSDSMHLKVKDHVLYYGKPLPILPPLNPDQFAFDRFMETRGIYDQIYLREGNHTRLSPFKPGIAGMARQLRDHVKGALRASSMGTQELGVLQAILLGDRGELDPEVSDHYRDAGAAHILAVSGLHIGILLLLIRILFKPFLPFRYGRPAAALLSLALIWGYAIFTGLSPSVVRAVTMFSFLTYALYLDRPANNFNVLALSVLGILLVHPKFLFEVGFQLSYAAVLAIAWIYPLLIRAWCPRVPALKRIWKLTAVSLSAQLGVLPLCLYYFHQFPGLFLVSSVILVPFLGFFLGTGVLVVALASLQTLPEFLALAYTQLIGAMNTVVRIISEQELFVIRDIPMDRTGLLLWYLLLFFLVLSIQKRSLRNLLFVGLMLICIQVKTLVQIHHNSEIREVYLLHQVGNSGMLYQDGQVLRVLSPDPSRLESISRNVRVNRRLHPLPPEALPMAFTMGSDRWIVLDSTANTALLPEGIDGLILTQSPRVHLGRILEGTELRQVVADGSNYPSDVKRWRKTCRSYGIPFHSTSEQGAFRLYSM